MGLAGRDSGQRSPQVQLLRPRLRLRDRTALRRMLGQRCSRESAGWPAGLDRQAQAHPVM